MEVKNVDYEKLRNDLLTIFTRKSYTPTYDRENLANEVIAAVKDQLEPKIVEEPKVAE